MPQPIKVYVVDDSPIRFWKISYTLNALFPESTITTLRVSSCHHLDGIRFCLDDRIVFFLDGLLEKDSDITKNFAVVSASVNKKTALVIIHSLDPELRKSIKAKCEKLSYTQIYEIPYGSKSWTDFFSSLGSTDEQEKQHKQLGNFKVDD